MEKNMDRMEEDIIELSEEEIEEMNMVLQAIANDIESGMPIEEIVGNLVESGLDEETAKELVNAIKEDLEDLRREEEFINVLASRLYYGEDPQAIIDELKDAGMDPDEAEEFITELNEEIKIIKKDEETIINATMKGVEEGKTVDEIVSAIKVTAFSDEDVRAFVEDLYREFISGGT